MTNATAKTIDTALTATELDLLTCAITCYKRELEEDVLMYKSFNEVSKDANKRINDLQTEYFDLQVLWKRFVKLEREVKTEQE
jgi:hypothetical protein